MTAMQNAATLSDAMISESERKARLATQLASAELLAAIRRAHPAIVMRLQRQQTQTQRYRKENGL